MQPTADNATDGRQKAATEAAPPNDNISEEQFSGRSDCAFGTQRNESFSASSELSHFSDQEVQLGHLSVLLEEWQVEELPLTLSLAPK